MSAFAFPFRISIQERWAIPQPALLLAAQLTQAAGPYAAILLTGYRFGLSEAGQLAYAQALSLPVFQLLSLQLKPLLLTHTALELPIGAAIRLRWATSLLGLVWLLALLPWAGSAAALAASLRWLENWSDIFTAHWQKDAAALRVFFASILRTLGLALSLALAPGLVPALALASLCSLTVLVLVERPPRTAPARGFSYAPILRRAFLLGFVLFLMAFQSSIPRLALEKWANLEALGSFATLSVVLQIGTLVSSSFGQVLLPRLHSAPVPEIFRLLLWPFSAGALILSAAHLLPLPAANGPVFQALCWAQLTSWPAAFLGCALTAKRLYRAQVWIVASLAAISAAASALLVPRLGAAGAAYALGVTGAAMLLLSGIVLQRSSRL
jgi:O-antigen/teichoic acid export membrane protein